MYVRMYVHTPSRERNAATLYVSRIYFTSYFIFTILYKRRKNFTSYRISFWVFYSFFLPRDIPTISHYGSFIARNITGTRDKRAR